MSSIYSEYTIYKTNDLVRIVPTEAKKPATGTSPEQSEEASRMYLDIDRASPLTVRYVQSNGMIPVPSSGNLVTKPQKIYGILGFLPFTSRDVRMIVVTERKYVGDLPYPLFRVVKTDVVVLGTDAASAVSAENPDSSEYRRLLGRILKVKSLYFATSWDATLNAQKRSDVYDSDTLRGVPLWQRADKRLFWNFSLVQPLIDINANEWILPVFMGHAELKHTSINGTEFDFGIVSRRYRTRAGMRLFMRGIDSSNNTANTVETEQMLIIPDNSAAPAEKKLLASYVLMRGSIPVYWSQFPDVRYKPPMTLTEPHQVNTAAATEHFRALVRNYGAPVYCVNLIDLKGKELVLAEEFGKCAQEAKDAGVNIEYTHFDFHKECKGGKTERLSILLDRIKDSIDSIGFFAQSLPANVEALQAGMDSLATPFAKQSGCFRVNCIDSLDRTNVVQSLIARKVLEEQFIKFGVFKAPSETLDTYPDFLYIYKNCK